MTLYAEIKEWIDARSDVQHVMLGRNPKSDPPSVYIRPTNYTHVETGSLAHYMLSVVFARRDNLDPVERVEELALPLLDGLHNSSLPLEPLSVSDIYEWEDPNTLAETPGWWSFDIDMETLT